MTMFVESLRGLRIGLGANVAAGVILTFSMTLGTTIFSIVDAVVSRPLPFTQPNALVSISPHRPDQSWALASPQQFFTWREGLATVTGLAAARRQPRAELQHHAGPTPVRVVAVTLNLFDVLGVQPAIGRGFADGDDRAIRLTPVVFSHQAWQRHFGADRSVVGQIVSLGGEEAIVRGILPPRVSFPVTAGPPTDVYVPYGAIATAERENNRGFSLWVVGRLKKGVTIEELQADAVRVSSSPVSVEPLHDAIVGPSGRSLRILLAAVGILILIGYVNVSTLLVARATGRLRELSVRISLGASYLRVAASLCLESCAVSILATVAAIVLSGLALRSVVPLLPTDLVRTSEILLNWRVLGVASAAAVVCGLAAGLLPAVVGARGSVPAMRFGSQVIGSPLSNRLLSTLFVADVAFVAILLVGSSLVLRSFLEVSSTELGFEHENLFRVDYRRSLATLPAEERSAASEVIQTQLLERLRSLPFVSSAALATTGSVPLSGGSVRYSLFIPGYGETGRDDWLETAIVSRNYFEVIGADLVGGRSFSPLDGAEGEPVLIINESAAKRFFPSHDPVGRLVVFQGPTRIIGVLRDIRAEGPEIAARPAMYMPIDQHPDVGTSVSGTVVIRSVHLSERVSSRLLQSMSEELGVSLGNLEQISRDYTLVTASRRLNAVLMVAFGLVATLVGGLGTYATIAFAVMRDARHNGIRLALGASPSAIRRNVLRVAVTSTTCGLVIGLGVAFLLAPRIGAYLFGVSAQSPLVYASVAGSLIALTVLAAYRPALRASAIDPLRVLSAD